MTVIIKKSRHGHHGQGLKTKKHGRCRFARYLGECKFIGYCSLKKTDEQGRDPKCSKMVYKAEEVQ